MSKARDVGSGDRLTAFTNALIMAAPVLSREECKALASYVLCTLSAASTGPISPPSSAGESADQLMQATQSMQETQMSFNLQYLQLQNSMQNDNRQFTAVSNIMKTKHDSVKNTISNIR